MTDREKLIELCETACSPINCEKYGEKHCFECVAEHLLANGVTSQKRIPVTERLPEEPGYVLAYWKYIQEDEMHIDRLNYNGECFPWEKFGFNGVHKVTHWMPLPEPPKE